MKPLSTMKNRMQSVKKSDVKAFVRDWTPTLFKISVMAIIATSVGDTASASSVQGVNTGIGPLDKPLQTIGSALSGPIPKIVTVGAVAMGGMSWAMGWEQQVMNRCIKGAGGGAIAIGAGEFLNSAVNDSVSAMLLS